MLPETIDDAKRQSRANRDTLQRCVPYRIGGKADDDDGSTRAHELREARKRLHSIGVVQRSHGYDGIERARFERGGEYVTVKPVNSRTLVSGTRSVEYRAIDIERHYARHAGGSKRRCQNPVTTANVENV